MKAPTSFLVISLSSLLLLTAAGQQSPVPPPLMPMITMSGLLRLVQTIPLPSEGYIDHLAIDVKGQRLFIAGEANKSLIVVGLREGKVIHVTEGLTGNPRKPLYMSETNEIWTDLSDNTVVAISGTTYAVTKTVALACAVCPTTSDVGAPTIGELQRRGQFVRITSAYHAAESFGTRCWVR